MMEAQQGGHGDAAAYTLGALDAAGRARFEGHAAGCTECLREVAAFRSVADWLALAVPSVAPPPARRARVLASARALVRELKPPAEQPAPVPLAARARGPARRRWWQWGERVAVAVAAASLLLTFAVGGIAATSHAQADRAARAAALLAETLQIMYQPGMVAKTLSGTEQSPQAKGKIWIVPESSQAVVMTYDLPRLGPAEAYQCWLTEVELRASGGVFKVDEHGRGYLMVKAPEALSRYRWVGVTREPARGSRDPTGPRLLRGDL